MAKRTINHIINKSTTEALREAHLANVHAAILKQPEVKKVLIKFPLAVRNNLYVGVYGNTVALTLYMSDLSSFKSTRLTAMLDKFATWDCATEDHTYSDSPNRDFKFTANYPWTPKPSASLRWLEKHAPEYIPTAFKIQVNINAYVKSDSKNCRIEVVQVEEKVVRNEIKRIVCA